MLLMQAQENEVGLDDEQLLFLAGGQTNTFNDEIMFMANLSSTDLVYDEGGPSYDFDKLFEVHDHDNYLDNVDESDEEHEIHNAIQPNDVVDSDAKYTSNSNIISYEHNVSDNEDQVVYSDVSSIPNDVVMIITNDIYEVAIGYKNPFYLSEAKEVKPILYNGHKIVKTHHARALVHDSEDTLEIAETTRKQMIKKIKDPECVKKKKMRKTNEPMIPSTGVKDATAASGSKPRSNTKKDRTLPAKSDKKKVEDIHRNNKSSVKQKNHWQPTRRKFTLGEQCPLTRFIESKVVPVKQPKSVSTSDIVIIERLSKTSQKALTRDVNGVDLIKGNHGTNLYIISVEDMMKSSPICLLSKASKNKSWLWHRRLSHLNFGTINDLTRKDLVRGLPRLKFEKDHLCFACQLRESQKYSHKAKSKNTNLKVLNTLYMDLCGPLQLNSIIERQNRTLIEDARSMIIFFKASMFLWAEAVATACYTQTRSLIHTHHNKTPYELVHDKKLNLKFLRVFGALCYRTNDSEDLGKLRPTTDIGIFVGYAPNKKGYRINNKRTRRIMETVHVQFDELTEPMAPVHISTGPDPIWLMLGQISLGLVPDHVPAVPYVPPINKDMEILFQPMFDEYFKPPSVERLVPPAPVVQVPVVSTGTPSSTTIDQDAPSTSYSPSSSIVQPPISHQDSSRGGLPKPLLSGLVNPLHRGLTKPPHSGLAIKPSSGLVTSGRNHNIHHRSESSLNLAEDDLSLGNLKFVPKGKIDEVFGMQIPKELITDNIKNPPYYNTYLEMVAKHDKKIVAKEGGKKKSASKADKPKKLVSSKHSKPAPAQKPKALQEKPSKPSPAKKVSKGKVGKVRKGKTGFQLVYEEEQTEHETKSEPQGKGEEYFIERDIQMSLESFQAPGQVLVGGVAIREPVAEATRQLPMTNSEARNEILKIDEEISKELSNTVALEEKTAKLDKGQLDQTLDKTTQALSSRIFTLELKDLPHKIDQTINEVVKEAVHIALQASLRDRFRELPKAYMKEIIHQRMLKSAWKSSDIRDVPFASLKQKTASQSKQPIEDIPMEECHLLLTDQVDLVNPKGHRVMPDVSKPLPFGGLPGQVTIQTQYLFNKDMKYLVSVDKGRRSALSISKLKATQYLDFRLEELVLSLWIESERDYDISVAYGIFH
uniref:Integrase, catalytic region, zinc finger, CCHC-type, peptidase aspartic, catalytic n=1 Tax=Tanacetum cinerariifolium TaxID=118510 RepID=A0A6L2MFQ4_TANCI|nr:integrase, catalytic region, zinc finger, CCHC-type, peptidase aspartic, catalytic [Tanacetum cinerariifolium]